MSGIVGSRLNIRGSGLVGSLGTDGQVFTSAGAGAGAVFEDAAGGGAWTFISKVTISDDTEIDIESGIDSTYPLYCFSFNNIKIATDEGYLLGRVKTDAFQTGSDYQYVNTDTRANGSVFDNGTGESTSATSMQIQNPNGQGAAATESFNHLVYLAHPSNTTYYKHLWGIGTGFRSDGAMCRHLFFGCYAGDADAVTGMKFYLHDGNNLTSGTISLFGIKDS